VETYTYNPTGEVTQIQYAEKAVGNISLTEAEKQLIRMYPGQAALVRISQQHTDEWTNKVFGEYYKEESWKDGDAANAYRHAMWNALMVMNLGEEKAKRWADAHEAWPKELDMHIREDGFSNGKHTEMDLHNNQIGIDIGVRMSGMEPDSVTVNMISEAILVELRRGNMDVLVDNGWYTEVSECD